MPENKFTVVEDSNVYYQGHYWNDYELVRQHINQRISGSAQIGWQQYFKNTHEGRVFKKALFINCGNGWVEREMYRLGLFEDAVGIDYLQPLIDEAEARARDENCPFRYYQMDINSGIFPETGFDLVVNHAGCHHIAYLNRVLVAVNSAMTEDGLFVNYDFVGAHRNQYPYHQWEAVHKLNQKLPEEVRQTLVYPHLPTMLVTDPTEAIHSELILEYTYQYFDIEVHKRGGGPLAYPILTFNRKMRSADPLLQQEWINYIMAEDLAFTEKHPDLSMFDFFAGTPNKKILTDHNLLQSLQEKENSRENCSTENKGMYYDLSLLQQLYIEMEDLRSNNNHMRIDLHRIYQNPLTFLAKYSTKEILAALKRKE